MDKIKLFEITFNKISGDRSYMAYYLRRVMDNEHKSSTEMMAFLKCTPDIFYKLALCRLPEIGSENYLSGINKIVAYTNISASIILNITERSEINTKPIAEKPLSLIEESWLVIQKLFTAHRWIYQPLITSMILILMIMPGFSPSHETKILKAYINDYHQYVDAMKYAHYQDNTFVLTKNLQKFS